MVPSENGNGAGGWLKVAERASTLANMRLPWGHPEELYLDDKVEVEGETEEEVLFCGTGGIYRGRERQNQK